MLVGALQEVGELGLGDVVAAGDEPRAGAECEAAREIGRSTEPNGVDGERVPVRLVGEY